MYAAQSNSVTTSAGNSNESLSTLLTQAAQRRVREDALLRAVEDYELEFGIISETEVDLGLKQLEARKTTRATKRRSA